MFSDIIMLWLYLVDRYMGKIVMTYKIQKHPNHNPKPLDWHF